jgi:hypothetical protein
MAGVFVRPSSASTTTLSCLSIIAGNSGMTSASGAMLGIHLQGVEQGVLADYLPHAQQSRIDTIAADRRDVRVTFMTILELRSSRHLPLTCRAGGSFPFGKPG